MSSTLLHDDLSQRNRLLRLHITLGAQVLVAEHLDGWEALDQGGFCLSLSALSCDGGLPIEQWLGAPVLLQVQCADSRDELRSFHGHLSHCTRVASNGGLARYQLRIEPWLALLRLRQDSYAFHDLNVMEICEQIFAFYRQGVVQPHWRWALDDPRRYRKRSLTMQYQETDLAFVQRLLAEEGIAYHVEHQGDVQAPGLGRHVLVLSDSNATLAPAPPVSVRFHRSDVTEADDSIQHCAQEERWMVGQVRRQSWDYRSHSRLSAQAQSDDGIKGCVDEETVGPYAWVDAMQGAQRTRQHLDAQRTARWQVQGQGTWRRLAAGSRICLSGHDSVPEGEPLLCLRVHHQARNNLDAQLQAAVLAGLGPVGEPVVELYRNHFTLISAHQVYRPQTEDGHGRRLHPVPTVHGAQSAIVIGDGGPLLTDRDHRIKVQFHWQRGTRSASYLAHPRQTDNAPADASVGTWVRVATAQAGQNWGSAWLPRVGQEVLVAFLEGNIDRPVVIGALYNGRGQANAPHNRVAGGASGSTGNAPAWFPGNGHAGVLSGWKTQDLATSHTGLGGYRQLQFDDSPGQSRIHLYTSDYHSGLTLGHLKLTQDNQRLADRGYGMELHTQAQGAVRAGAGLLLSTEPADQQMQAQGLFAELEKAQAQVQQLAASAHRQNAGWPTDAAQLPVDQALRSSLASLAATCAGQPSAAGIGGGEGQAVAWSRPMLALYGQAGVLSLAAQDQIWAAGSHGLLNAGGHLNLTAQGHCGFLAENGLVLFTRGAAAEHGPVTTPGIALHAATGAVSLQARSDTLNVAAQRDLHMRSTQASARVQGHRQVLLHVQGAAIRLRGGNIEITAPGSVTFKAQHHALTGPAQRPAPTLPALNPPVCVACLRHLARLHRNVSPRG